AALADDDAGFRGIYDDACLIGAAFDLDFADRRGPNPPVEKLANGHVFVKPLDVVLFLEPAAIPRPRDAKTQSDRMNFLAHDYPAAPALAAAVCLRRLRPVVFSPAAAAGARRVRRPACTDAPARLRPALAGRSSLT